MLADISLGRYVAGGSAIHRLDPRTKTIGVLALAVAMVQGDSLAGTAWHVALALGIVALAGLPARFVLRSMRPFAWLAGIVFASHIVVSGLAGWTTGVSLSGRLVAMVLLASLLSWTTQPLAIVSGLRALGWPLERLGLPVDAGATAIGLSLRFAPIALSEAQSILRAQAARGADFRGFRRKIALIVPMLGTLFERAFARADMLAEAMESRGYAPGAPRTQYRRLGFSVWDLAAAIAVAVWIVAGVVIDRGGW